MTQCDMHMRLDHDQDGGGIYQEPIGTFTFNGLATFLQNTASNVSQQAAPRVRRSSDLSMYVPEMCIVLQYPCTGYW